MRFRSPARAVACAAATALDALVREAQRADEGRRLETAGLTRSLFPCWYAIWFFGLAAFLPELAASAATSTSDEARRLETRLDPRA